MTFPPHPELAAMRGHLGEDVPLMVDANMRWTVDQAGTIDVMAAGTGNLPLLLHARHRPHRRRGRGGLRAVRHRAWRGRDRNG